MSRRLFSCAVALWLAALTFPAQGNFDCDQAYKTLEEKIARQRSGNMSREQSASLRRWARRVHDACQTGDLVDPKALFDRLERESH